MPTPTVENYLKKVYTIAEKLGDARRVPMGLLAEKMEVVPGTATTMAKHLEQLGLLDYKPRIGVLLTPNGRVEALRVLRKHRIVEMFLVDVLNLDWSEIHEEAELLEHAISDKLLEKMDAYLDYPSVDPHGDPIPSKKGTFEERPTKLLSDCAPSENVRIAQITRQDPDFLSFVYSSKLTPGTRLQIESIDEAADLIRVQSRETGQTLSLGPKAAAHILVHAGTPDEAQS